MNDPPISSQNMVERITAILRDYRDGLHDSDEDAALAILEVIRTQAESIIEHGEEETLADVVSRWFGAE